MDGSHVRTGSSIPSFVGMLADEHAVRPVFASVRSHGPAVVLPGLQDVQFVAALRPVFVRPDGSRFRMDREPLRVSVAVGEDLGLVSVLSEERIARRRRAVFRQPQNLSAVDRGVLRAVAIAALPDGHVQRAVGAEGELRAEVRVAGVAVVRHEQILRLGQRLAVEPPAQQRRRRALLAGLRIGEIQPPVLAEPRDGAAPPAIRPAP